MQIADAHSSLIFLKNHNRSIHILTAMWALCESGLGGILHALQIPVSGLLLGSLAVIIISFIARESGNSFKTIIRCTAVVIAIKAIGSPHSPFTSYIAVLFQGLAGAAFFSIFGSRRWVCVLLGIVALTESAIQKLLVLWLIFGNSLWQSFKTFIESVRKIFGMQGSTQLPNVLLGSYLLLYAFMGVVAGIIAWRLPLAVERSRLQALPTYDIAPVAPSPKKVKRGWMFILLIALFIVCIQVMFFARQNVLYVLLRTITGLLFLWLVIGPVAKWLLMKWAGKAGSQSEVLEIQKTLPRIRRNFINAVSIAKQQSGYASRAKAFLLSWFALSLYGHESPAA